MKRGRSVVEPYNTVVCLRLIMEHNDVAMRVDDEAFYDFSRRNLDVLMANSFHVLTHQGAFVCDVLHGIMLRRPWGGIRF